jgi:RNA polymerase sigma factor (sigma-70 family)
MAPSSSRFPTTRRSALRATRSDDPGERRAAWETVIAAYWKPAYKYVRLRWNQSPADAEDLVQGFFARVLEKEFFARYDADRGLFRTWFRTCLDGYLSNERQAQAREKRGGGVRTVPLDFAGAEAELARQAASALPPPEECFHREWQRHVFGLAVEDLRRHCESAGKSVPFSLFVRYDLSEDRAGYDSLAAEFHLPVTAVTNHLAAMRRLLRRFVLGRLREMTVDDREFQSEARALLGGGAR